jgi:hypothetical protein
MATKAIFIRLMREAFMSRYAILIEKIIKADKGHKGRYRLDLQNSFLYVQST